MGEGEDWNAVSIPRSTAGDARRSTSGKENSEVPSVWTPDSPTGVYGVAESIAAKNRSNLYRTSCYLREEDRYRAFCAYYAIMRIVDDHVDGFLSGPCASAEDHARAFSVVEAWHHVLSACVTGETPAPRDAAHPDQLHIGALPLRLLQPPVPVTP